MDNNGMGSTGTPANWGPKVMASTVPNTYPPTPPTSPNRSAFNRKMRRIRP